MRNGHSNLSVAFTLGKGTAMQQCKGRKCAQTKELRSPKGVGYFTEKRCQILTKNINELCDKCHKKSEKPFNPQNQQSQYQGKVDEPYFENSWIYGSPRYLKKNDALPREAEEEAAEAQRIARQGVQMKGDGSGGKNRKTISKTAGSANTVVSSVPNNNIVNGTGSSVASVSTATPVAPVIKKSMKVIKKNIALPTATVASVPIAVESTEPPLEAASVVKIYIRPIEIAGTMYWYAPSKDKVYEKRKDGSCGPYKGRWNAADQALVNFPDSDLDV
jgi:hypothetical protein